MRDRRPGWAVAAASLLGLVVQASVCSAQFSGPQGLPVFANNPQPPAAPEFLGPHQGPGPDFPNVGKAPPKSPFQMNDDGAPNGFCDFEDHRPPPPMICWLKGEYLRWRLSSYSTDTVLVTTSSAPDLTNNFGALGQSGTEILFGPANFSHDIIEGGRITLGVGPDFCPPIEIGGFWVDGTREFFRGSSSGALASGVLARPVLGVNTGQELVFLAGFPGVATGDVIIAGDVSLWGIEANLFFPLFGSDVLFVEGLLGFRYLELEDTLAIRNTLFPTDPNFVVPFNGDPNGFGVGFGTIVDDVFQTRNQFYGAQIGARTSLAYSRLEFGLETKLGIGSTHQKMHIAGASTLTTPTSAFRGTNTVPGGILAVESNSGTHSDDDITIVPEVAANFTVQLHHSIRLLAGVNFLYWSSTVRPGDLLNNVIDTRQAPTDVDFSPTSGATQPPPPGFNRTSFWAYGFNLGIQIGF